MIALRWSYGRDLILVAALGVITFVAVPHHHRHHHHRHVRYPYNVAIEVPTIVNPAADAEVYYQRHEFTLAADSLRKAAERDASLEANAQLYEQLARAWDRAFAKDATPVTRFEALRYARRIDLAIGGRFAEELDGYLRTTAPIAAEIYRRDHNREGLELALTTCDALGVAIDRQLIGVLSPAATNAAQ
jgi:hypothetical protein